MTHEKFTPRRSRGLTLLVAILMFAGSSLAAGPKEKTIYHFQGGSDGAIPFSNLVADKAGNLYGTTLYGGTGNCGDGCGTVFQLKPPHRAGGVWTETVLYNFVPYAHSEAGLILDPAGNLYGTTYSGGQLQNGTVFELKPPSKRGGAWIEKTLYSFAGGKDGSGSIAGLIFDSKGNLYGTTQYGGTGKCTQFQRPNGCGTAFQLRPPTKKGGPWIESVLYSFTDQEDGSYPAAALILDSAGNLYGTSVGDQTNSDGAVFQLAPPAEKGGAWTETTLYSFGFVDRDGIAPYGGLIFDTQGNLYGTTSQGGNNLKTCASTQTFGCGTIFELEPTAQSDGAWKEKVLYRFKDGSDGEFPQAGLLADHAGNFYGTSGGPFVGGNGTVFKLNPPPPFGHSWTLTTLHTFGKGDDGYSPSGAVIVGDGGALLGMTSAGGGKCLVPPSCGIAFELVP
jgi:uncharacterized repeat protein (TIGR03803 family)